MGITLIASLFLFKDGASMDSGLAKNVAANRIKYALRLEAQREQTIGLRQFSLPDEKPIRHTKPDPTASQAIGRRK